ncbi:fasciculation and elongation protein zeta-2 isoform X4 [Phymastichus coffea]|uniref:fasciculation and elongation protein zeta-2 isoform X4 n=1 Tax=Phymastichus coffea TaxID=108790 RepID=UPI00273A7676|nr:fasciculation and elongation protein zeta-2 isoform X4 [Phymastichus coffea]
MKIIRITIPRDRRSFSYSSRSSVSSRLSRYILSESSKSRSPSIPRRYGSPSFLERRRITRVTGYNSEFVIMKDMATKIAELKFEAPLACFEEEDTSAIKNRNIFSDQLVGINIGNNYIESPNCNTSRIPDNTDTIHDGAFSPFSGSLEDLVNTFDEKITSCFKDYGTNVESLAPVQVRTQEEIMNECQMWWTITGTFGNILPIDWNKSYARKMHVPTLNLNDAIKPSNGIVLEDLSSEDEAVATDLDMHALILSSRNENYNIEEPVKTADEVLREIDDIMQESPVDESFHSECFLEINEALERSKEVLSSPLHEKRLEQYSSKQLLEFLSEMDSLISALSESLINELALRDELEYEKELKNQFISLLLAVQNRRRQHHVAKKRNQSQTGSSPLPQQKSFHESKYLTTVIPYHTDNGNLDNQALQVLIKILKAINEDSPAVPALLTDYILKVLCPT